MTTEEKLENAKRGIFFPSDNAGNEGSDQRKKKTVRVPERIKFFSTIEDELYAIDNNEMLHEISSKYPEMTKFEDNELSGSRMAFLNFLEDEAFISDILERYDMTFQDLLSCMYSSYGQLLSNLPFIRKVRKIVLSASYIVQRPSAYN